MTVNEHLSLLVEHFVLTIVILVRNKDKPWFDEQVCIRPHADGLEVERLITSGGLL